MMRKTRLSKWIAGFMVATLIWTGTSWNNASVSAAASMPFSDVKAGHWAEKHIAKLAYQKILSGYEGKFNPNNPVSHQEAVIMAIFFLGIEDEIKSSDVIVLPETLKIKEDYKKYLNLAFKKQLLNISEEVALAEKDKSKEWGKSPASREWVTRLLVRAIGKDSAAKLAAAQPTTFPDDAKIDSKYRGYVNVAVSTGLVKGVTTLVNGITITEFAPAADVNRASIATLFSLAQSEVAFSGQISGVILSISPTQLTLLLESGSSQTYTITPNTLIYRYDSNLRVSIGQLKQYGEVNLISNSDKSVGYVEQTSDTTKIKTYEGTLKVYTANLNRLTVQIGNELKLFTYYPQNLPTITDINGKVIALKDLQVNVDLKLTVENAFSTEGKIIAITVKPSTPVVPVVNKSGTGTVAAWNAATRSLRVDDPVAEKSELFTVDANATIKNNNGANLTLDQLKVGDSITYEVKTGLVSSIVVTKTEQLAVSGILEAIVKSNNSIQYTVNNKLQSDYLANNVKVKIDGIPDATIDDIYKGDVLTLTFNASGTAVTQITITSRTVKTLIGATVGSFAIADKTLIVYDSNGIKYNLDVTASTKFDLNGTILPLETAAPLISTKGKKINIVYSGTNAIFVSLIAKYTGTVTENNLTAKTLGLTVDTLGSTKINYSFPNVEIYGQTSMTYADIVAGDKVTVILNSNQDQVASILLHKNAQLEVVSVTPVGNKLKVKRSDGVIEEWTLTSTVALQNENGTAINLSAFTIGGFINVSFQGNTPVKIKAVPAGIFGKVSSVNTSASSLNIITSSNAATTKSVGTNPIVMRDNVVLASLASVLVNDRVEIRMDENDRTVVQIVTPIKKTVWKIATDTQTLSVTHSFDDTNYSYKLDSGVYIHQGTTTLSLSDLKIDDNISLYFLRGKVVEVVKL
jgi:hypothetical protein